MKILGIEIKKKTDILAFAAFIMSLGSLIIQFKYLIQGSKLVFESPKNVLIMTDANNDIRLSAKLTYFNEGSPDYHAIVKSEEAHIEFPNKTIILTASSYIRSEENKENKDDKPKIRKKSDADPVQVKSGDTVSHETYFVPFPTNTDNPDQNFIKYPDFISLIEQYEQVDIRFISLDNKNKTREDICTLKTKYFIKSFKRKKWSSTVCINRLG